MKCKIEDCDKEVQAKGLCYCHYQRLYRQGRRNGIIKPPIRNKNQSNEVIFDNDICIIKLYNHKGYEIEKTIIDTEDYDKVKNRKWHLGTLGYAITTRRLKTDGRQGQISLSHLVLGHKSNQKNIIDHINRNKLDNRKTNLRLADKSQNARNSKLRIDNQSGHRGISWDKERNRWFVHIGVNGKNIAIGRFKDKSEAIKAYIGAALKYHGEYLI